ncbi:MAG: multidrug effflux MFS transporter [Alphaproteobacteria bacterium]|nr:multidrug effflux MFS transporter [Alphaproteobacteria bacterium]
MNGRSERAMIYLLGALSAVGWVGGVMYLPGLPAIGAEFGATTPQVNLTLTVFLATFAVAQLFYGPLSDRYGRRVVLLTTLVVYAFGSALGALATSIEFLTVARIVQAAGAVGGIVLTRAIARDIWTFDQVRRPLAFINMGSAVAPILSLSTGGLVVGLIGWRGIFWIAGGLALVALAVCAVMLRETHTKRDPGVYGGFNFIRNLLVLARSPRFLSYSVTQGMLGGAIFVFMIASPVVVIQTMGLSPEVFGLLTALMPLGYSTGNFVTSELSRRQSIERLMTLGMAVSLAAAAAMVVFASLGSLGIPVLYICMYCYTLGVGITLPNSMAAAIEVRPQTAGAASSLIGFLQQGHSAVASRLVSVMESGSGHALVALLAAMAVIGSVAGAVSNVLARGVTKG